MHACAISYKERMQKSYRRTKRLEHLQSHPQTMSGKSVGLVVWGTSGPNSRLEEVPFLATSPKRDLQTKIKCNLVSGVPDGASIHRGWTRDAGQYLGRVRSEAAFGACDWDAFLAGVDATGDALTAWI
jgi:hypothetical protein